MVSYDSRKRIIFYETFRTEVERMLEDDEARQGIRIRMNANPLKYINAGIAFSTRFQNDDLHESNNTNAYLSHGKLPYLGGRASVNYNINRSDYLESKIMAFRYARNLIHSVLDGDFYYRSVSYAYLSSEFTRNQNYFGSNLTFRMSGTWMFSILGEYSTSDTSDNY